MSPHLEALQRRIGHRFADIPLLQTALTHASAGESENYQRLEFLGDRVLGLAIADILYARFPAESEGALARRLAALVQAGALARVARRIGLGEALILSGHEKKDNDNILADSLEALLGALYREAGFPACRAAVDRLWQEEMDAAIAPPQDPKTALQEWAQGRGLPLPSYTLVAREGPDHAPLFTLRVAVEGHAPAECQAPSRRAAEKGAAEKLLRALQEGSP